MLSPFHALSPHLGGFNDLELKPRTGDDVQDSPIPHNFKVANSQKL